ncbi:hypothetical protein, partial [Photobacterium alginatilyticum]|uniref:hypothetical protein n=1 Tax=Photobacterium alginatilyticum TaxID=1775171 RepID=UPI0019625716
SWSNKTHLRRRDFASGLEKQIFESSMVCRRMHPKINLSSTTNNVVVKVGIDPTENYLVYSILQYWKVKGGFLVLKLILIKIKKTNNIK